jgi:phosphatidylinositol N-acetylglucosaminyltransferase subunit A
MPSHRRENTVLRASLQPSIVHVIPNALIADQFKPSTTPVPTGISESGRSQDLTQLTIVHISYYCRSITLCISKRCRFISSHSPACVRSFSKCAIFRRYAEKLTFPVTITKLITGGDGPKLIELLQMREKHLLQDRIILLGPVRHTDVRGVCTECIGDQSTNDSRVYCVDFDSRVHFSKYVLN